MKNLIIIILASILAPNCNRSPEDKAVDTLKSEMYASVYSIPSLDKNSREIELVDFRKIPRIHRIMDSNTSHIFIGQEKEVGQVKDNYEYEWLIHDPDCPKCLQR